MTLSEWNSRAEFAAELKKVLESPVFKIATQLVEDFMSPTRIMLGAPDALLATHSTYFVSQIKGFEMRKVAYEALAGDVVKSQQLEAQYGINAEDLIKEVRDAAAAATISKPAKPNKRK